MYNESNMLIAMIAAADRNGLIGVGNRLPWHLPADLMRFKRLTMGKPIVMGRKTFESIGHALPGRHNIIITRNPNFHAQDCTSVSSVAAALGMAAQTGMDEIFIIGGAQVYSECLSFAQRIYLTRVEYSFDMGDTYFPELDQSWHQVSCETHTADAQNRYAYSFLVLERKTK